MTRRFEERGMATPRLDAEILVAHVLTLPRVSLYVQFERPLEPDELADLRGLVGRRQRGEPVAYLTGRKEFWGLTLRVDGRVLVPRPDSETVIEEALARLDARPPGAAPPRMADVGTGSGALALALCHGRPAARVVASDVSADALSVARDNASRLGLESRVTFAEGDLAAPLFPHAPFDLVVANLPYVPAAEIDRLPREVRAEPRLALDGGPDGLGLVRKLVTDAPGMLMAGGALVLEVGAGQAPLVVAACVRSGLTDVRTRRDLAGIERVVSARRPGRDSVTAGAPVAPPPGPAPDTSQ